MLLVRSIFRTMTPYRHQTDRSSFWISNLTGILLFFTMSFYCCRLALLATMSEFVRNFRATHLFFSCLSNTYNVHAQRKETFMCYFVVQCYIYIVFPNSHCCFPKLNKYIYMKSNSSSSRKKQTDGSETELWKTCARLSHDLQIIFSECSQLCVVCVVWINETNNINI